MAGNRPAKFGARLRQTRELQNLTQSQLADAAGLTPAAISQLEAGDRLPAFKTLTRLAGALSTSVGYLMGEESTQLPSELQAFFRDLEGMEANDLAEVRKYAAFLKNKGTENKK